MQIWCLHDIVPGPADQPWEISAEDLEEAIERFTEFGYEFADAGQGSWYRAGTILLTFDDGTAGAARWLVERAPALGLSAIFFAVIDWLDNLPPRSPQHAYRGLASWHDVASVRDSQHVIGSHSMSHVRLAGQPEHLVGRELRASRERLMAMTGTRVRHFAAPFGSLDGVVVALAGEVGYATVSSTTPGENLGDRATSPRVLNRIVLRSDLPGLGLPDAADSTDHIDAGK